MPFSKKLEDFGRILAVMEPSVDMLVEVIRMVHPKAVEDAFNIRDNIIVLMEKVYINENMKNEELVKENIELKKQLQEYFEKSIENCGVCAKECKADIKRIEEIIRRIELHLKDFEKIIQQKEGIQDPIVNKRSSSAPPSMLLRAELYMPDILVDEAALPAVTTNEISDSRKPHLNQDDKEEGMDLNGNIAASTKMHCHTTLFQQMIPTFYATAYGCTLHPTEFAGCCVQSPQQSHNSSSSCMSSLTSTPSTASASFNNSINVGNQLHESEPVLHSISKILKNVNSPASFTFNTAVTPELNPAGTNSLTAHNNLIVLSDSEDDCVNVSKKSRSKSNRPRKNRRKLMKARGAQKKLKARDQEPHKIILGTFEGRKIILKLMNTH